VDSKVLTAVLFGGIAFVLTFSLPDVVGFAFLTLFSGFVGYLLSYVRLNFESAWYRYGSYAGLLIVLFVVSSFSILMYSLGTLEYQPVAAKNPVTGEISQFDAKSKPWYYQDVRLGSGRPGPARDPVTCAKAVESMCRREANVTLPSVCYPVGGGPLPEDMSSRLQNLSEVRSVNETARLVNCIE
jgi:hypothetical protein